MIMAPNRQYQLVSFGEAAPAKDRNLVWSVVPVLLPHLVPPQLCWSTLGLSSPPARELVVQHLMNLCKGGTTTTTTMARRGDATGAAATAADGGGSVLDRWVYGNSPVVVFQSIFKYLEEHWDSIPPRSKTALKDLPCVPVGNRLVKAARLYFRLTQDLAPFMFEVPRAFGAYDTLFTALGTRTSPSPQDYALLLTELQGECGDSSLNPNELEAVLKVVVLLAETLSMQGGGEREGGREGGRAVDEVLRGWRLYLPDDRSVLVPLDTCLYDDASWLRGRVHAHLLRVVHPRIGLETCESFGIPRISAVVREALEKDFVPVSAADFMPASEASSLVGDTALLAATLTSKEFAHALACLLLTQQQRETTNGGAASFLARLLPAGGGAGGGSGGSALLLEDMASALHEALKGFKVEFVTTLRSRFLRRHGEGEEEEDITSQPEGSMFYVDNANRTVLLAVTLLPPSVTPAYVLALAVVQIFALGGREGEWLVAPMSALLATHPPANIKQVMHLLRLNARDETRAQHLRRGVPGQLLHDVDRQRVEFRPMRVHMQGEIVAWQSGGKRAAAGAADIGGDRLRYGVVVSGNGERGNGDGSNSSGGVVRRLLIRVAPNKVQEMLSTQIYSFSATTRGTLASATCESEAQGRRASGGGGRAQVKAPAVAVPPLLQKVKKEEGDEGVEEKKTAAATSSAPVESTQLLAAVDDILSRVNLSLGEDTKDVLARNIRLQRDLEAAYRETQSVREEAHGLSTELESIKQAFQCHICFQRNVNEILAPCGHTTCSTCRESCRVCPFCREGIESYFPFHTNHFLER